jgi:hypothetical protein
MLESSLVSLTNGYCNMVSNRILLKRRAQMFVFQTFSLKMFQHKLPFCSQFNLLILFEIVYSSYHEWFCTPSCSPNAVHRVNWSKAALLML